MGWQWDWWGLALAQVGVWLGKRSIFGSTTGQRRRHLSSPDFDDLPVSTTPRPPPRGHPQEGAAGVATPATPEVRHGLWVDRGRRFPLCALPSLRRRPHKDRSLREEGATLARVGFLVAAPRVETTDRDPASLYGAFGGSKGVAPHVAPSWRAPSGHMGGGGRNKRPRHPQQKSTM